MAIKNYTTEIPAARTIGEIEEMLVGAGAKGIYKDVESKKVAAINFVIDLGDITLSYRLPCRWQQIYKLLEGDTKAREMMRSKGIKFGEDHCRAVGWRIVRDWLHAQLALIEAEMAEMQEVMMPYMLARDGRTAYEVMGGGRLLLERKD